MKRRPASVLLFLTVACSLTPGQGPAVPMESRPMAAASRRAPSAAEIDRHVAALRKKVAGEAFHIVVESPFVIVGDEDPEDVEDCALRVVRWARALLRKQFFARDPDRILDVWLFKNKASYIGHCKRWFGGEPSTPYGYFSERYKALIMNIETGTGTLVHELVHPYIEANFPECPAWFNEGLASLYEHSSERDGRIVGHVNWRLAGLKSALLEGRVPSFQKLTSLTPRQFYSEQQGVYYAQARYLCYYLQEQGALEEFYRRLSSGIDKDPTGYESLQAVLGTRDMDRFMADWSRFVMALVERR